MTSKILPFIRKYIWLITTIIALGGLLVSLFQARTEAKSPNLNYYVIKVNPEINDNDLQKARRALEDSLFQSVNDLVARDSSLTYSEALDSILPLSDTVDNLSAGVVIVIKNLGEVTAHNLRANIALEVPIEDYEIFSNELVTIINENKPQGTLKINIDRLTSDDEVQIAILFPGAYTVSLTVSRAEPSMPTNLAKIMATKTAQTAIGSSEQDIGNSSNGFLQFYTESRLDNIQTKVFVSSDEVQGDNNVKPRDASKERNLFFGTFQQ